MMPSCDYRGFGRFRERRPRKRRSNTQQKNLPRWAGFFEESVIEGASPRRGDALTFDLGQFHVFSFQAAGLGTGRTLPVVGLFQLAISFCHDFKS